MRSLALALGLCFALALCGPAQGQPVPVQCNKAATTATLTVGTTAVVAGVAGKSINVCGYALQGLAAGSVQLVFGTGGTCTTSTAFTPVYTLAATTVIVDHIESAWTTNVTPGQTVCAIVTGTSSLVMTLFYSQF